MLQSNNKKSMDTSSIYQKAYFEDSDDEIIQIKIENIKNYKDEPPRIYDEFSY